MMRRIKLALTQITWVIIIACAVFTVVMMSTDSQIIIRIGNYMSLSLSIACVIRYRYEAWNALTSFRPTGINVLGLGIFLSWCSTQLRVASSTLLRDFDIWWLNDVFLIPAFLFLAVLSGVFCFAGPRIERGKMNRHTLAQLALVLFFGIVPALVITVFI